MNGRPRVSTLAVLTVATPLWLLALGPAYSPSVAVLLVILVTIPVLRRVLI